MATHKTILRKTIQVGTSTLLSRVLGIIREMLQVRYLGLGMDSDAFITAFKIPNSLRKIFAEGALSAAFIPTIIHMVKYESTERASKLMSASFLMFEGMLALVCLGIFAFPHEVLHAVASGFSDTVIDAAVPYVRILISMILFISTSSLLAGALQSVHHFFIPAIAPAILNVIYITGLVLGLLYNLPVIYLCYFILAGSMLNLVLHVMVYMRYGFSFSIPDRETLYSLWLLLKRFLPFMLSMSIMEINFFVDTAFASYLALGTTSLLYYANRLMAIPLGVFAAAFSTILLPHFSRVSLYAPRRLNFYLYEAMKLILWITIPAALWLAYFAPEIYTTLFVSKKFPIEAVPEACYILLAFLVGLSAFSLNKILLNLYYSLHDSQVPTIASIISTGVNVAGDFVLMQFFRGAGLALATSLAGIAQTLVLLYFLQQRYHFNLYLGRVVDFLVRYALQLAILAPGFIVAHVLTKSVLTKFVVSGALSAMLPTFISATFVSDFLLQGIGFWLWTGPIVILWVLLIGLTRKMVGYRLFFID